MYGVEGKDWSKLAARSARTVVKQSSKGYRAYGEVSVTVHDEDCDNTTTLYVAAPGAKEFKVVYTTSQSGGNGIRLVDRSPSGERLLAEITFWTYESDVGFGYLPVIYNASTNSAREVQSMDKALVGLLGSDCGFEDHVRGWRTEEQLLIIVSPSLGVEQDEESSCVKQPRSLLYNLRNDTLQTRPAQNKSN